MSVLAPEAPPFEPSPPRRRSRRLITLGVVGVLAVVGCVTWLTERSPNDDGVTFYPSASFMAKRIGCRDTFRTEARPGGSSSAGECVTRSGARVEFRIYLTASEASAWLDGAREQSTSQIQGAGAVGGNWAVLITRTQDLTAIKPVMQALT